MVGRIYRAGYGAAKRGVPRAKAEKRSRLFGRNPLAYRRGYRAGKR